VTRFYKAGDIVTVINGPHNGQTATIGSVRMFASDSGYYLNGIDGLVSHKNVALHQERQGPNPCGSPCIQKDHDLLDTCDHCRGVCLCSIRRLT
jgi:hypothetical protein